MKVLVTGKWFTGKSTLVNGLFNARIRSKRDVGSTDIQVYRSTSRACQLTVYDTPGEEINATAHLQWIQENHSQIDIVLFCIKMSDQVRKEDRSALASLAKTFGGKIWNRVVVILTFGNQVEAIDPEENTEAYYNKILSSMQSQIRLILKDPTLGMGVEPLSVADKIPIVPVGHPEKHVLPGCNDWRAAVVTAFRGYINGSQEDLLALKHMIESDSPSISQSEPIIAQPRTPYYSSWCTNLFGGITKLWRRDSSVPIPEKETQDDMILDSFVDVDASNRSTSARTSPAPSKDCDSSKITTESEHTSVDDSSLESGLTQEDSVYESCQSEQESSMDDHVLLPQKDLADDDSSLTPALCIQMDQYR